MNAAEIDEKFTNVTRYGLMREYPRKKYQRMLQNENVSEIVVNVTTDRTNHGKSSENNDDENSILRLKEGVLNKTRLLQMKLEEMKMKVAATPE